MIIIEWRGFGIFYIQDLNEPVRRIYVQNRKDIY